MDPPIVLGKQYDSLDRILLVSQVNRYPPTIQLTDGLVVGIGSRVAVNVVEIQDRDTDDEYLSVEFVMLPTNGWFQYNNVSYQ